MRLRRCRISAPAQSRRALAAFAFIIGLSTLLSGCRQDMHNQPKFIPLRSSEFFPDRRSARLPVAGTIPQIRFDERVDQEQLNPNSYFLTGRQNGALGNQFPGVLTREVLERGRERYNVYCTPCHSLIGDGRGMIVQRGYKAPPSFHQERLRQAPLGHFYDVMSNGFGAMPDYASQIKPEDRWAIAAYIRALQRSQNASVDDVDPQDRDKLTAPSPYKIKIPPTSRDPLNPQATQPANGGGKQ